MFRTRRGPAATSGPGPPATFAALGIRDIVADDSWQLRYQLGPDSATLLQWRASMTDEEWVDFWARDDEDWAAVMQAAFGVDLRPLLA